MRYVFSDGGKYQQNYSYYVQNNFDQMDSNGGKYNCSQIGTSLAKTPNIDSSTGTT